MRVSGWDEIQEVLSEIAVMQRELMTIQGRLQAKHERLAALVRQRSRESDSDESATVVSPVGSTGQESWTSASSRRSIRVGDRVEVATRGRFGGQKATVLSRRGVLFWNLRLDSGEETHRMRHNVRLIIT